ncbi:MAG: hypothetical protein BWY99_02137 [Synergistetes bacterium ADurb.BinA166]|nr:MAG: hypothetical protein BWY99_02137 [Synergistetes bacterium ADurb.BinA166]
MNPAKESGTYGIIQGVCEESIKSISEWRTCEQDVDKALEFLRRFHDLLGRLKSWEATPPTPDEKSRCIKEIFGARTEATDWAKERRLKL